MRIPGPAILLPMFLAGCAIPPAVTVASLVADGVSLVTTGKSTADHAISAVANEDCALFRAVNDQAICDPDGEVLIAFADVEPVEENWTLDPETGVVEDFDVDEQQAADEPQTAPQFASAAVPGESDYERQAPVSVPVPALTPGPVGQGAPLSMPADATMAAAKPLPRGVVARVQPLPAPRGADLPHREIRKVSLPQEPAEPATRMVQASGQVLTYAVIGSFRNVENARRASLAHGDEGLIQTVVVNGAKTHRVLLDRPVEQARRDGFQDAWPVRLCADDLGQPPCGHFVVSNEGVYVEMASR